MSEPGEHLPNVVAAAEPPQIVITPQGGPLVSVIHTERQMKIFGVTENELRTLTIVNAAIALLTSLGTGFFVYLLNLSTDAMFAGKLDPTAKNLLSIVKPGLWVFGIVFYLAALYAWLQRDAFIDTIKTESNPSLRNQARAEKKGKLGKIWEAIKS
jgi:hypothetical protein